MAFLDKTGLERLWLHILSKTNQTLASAKSYADDIKNDLLNGAGGAYDTLKELGDLIDENADAIDAIERLADTKSDKGHIHDDRYYTEAEIDDALKFVKEASGEVIVVNDSAEQQLLDLKLYGKTEQNTTTGKNLLPNTVSTTVNNGITFTSNTDGTIVANGTSMVDYDAYCIVGTATLEVGKKYLLTGCPSGGGFGIGLDGTGIYDWGDGIEFTAETENYTPVLIVGKNKTISNIVFKPMVRLASVTDATYEPYTGGMASPNPDYPQELVNIGAGGNIGVYARGKNLLNIATIVPSSAVYNGITITSLGNGFTAKGTATGNAAFKWALDDPIPAGTYWLHARNVGFNSACTLYFEKPGIVDVGHTTLSSDYRKQKIASDGALVYLKLYIPSGQTVDMCLYPMLTVEDTDTWEEYKDGGSLTASTPNGLPGIPVTSGGNYTDGNGQQWVCDEIDFGRGVYVENVKKTVIGSDTVLHLYGNDGVDIRVQGRMCGNVLCNIAEYVRAGELYSGQAYGMSENFDYDQIVFRLEGYSTVDEYRALFTVKEASGNPVTVLHAIDPTETPLSADELSAYRAMTSQKPTTTVYNDAGAGMIVEYADVKIDDIEKVLIDPTLSIKGTAAEAQIVGKELQHLQKETQFLDEAKGDIITINNSAELPLNNLKLYGKTTQNTTEGRNLLNLLEGRSGEGDSSVTHINRGDGSYTRQGTATERWGNVWFAGTYQAIPNDTNVLLTLLPGQTYYISQCALYTANASGTAVVVFDPLPDTSGYVGGALTVNAATYPDGIKVTGIRCPQLTIGTTYNDIIYPAIYLGNKKLEWEPYTGSIPSPNPNYPQDLVNIGNSGSIGVKANGKNLIGNTLTTLTTNGITFTKLNDGGVKVTGTSTAVAYYNMDFVNKTLIIGQTYTASINEPSNVHLYVGYYTGTNLSTDFDLMGIVYNNPVTFIVPKTYIGNRFYLRVESGITVDTIIYPQIEIGSVATAYEPFKNGGSLTISTPNGLPGIPVSSGENYVDENGQMWLCDEIDFERGVYVQNLLTITLNGSNYPFTVYNKGFSAALPYGYDAAYGDYRAISSHLTFDGYIINTNSMGRDDAFAIYRHPDPVVDVCSVFIRMTRFATADELNTWLASNPVTVMYPRRKPIETPLSTAELAAYRAMTTQNPTTTIYNDAGTDMYVSYGTYKAGEMEEALGIPKVDKTLTIDGAAADAKAVGDALAGKQPVGNYAGSSSAGGVATNSYALKSQSHLTTVDAMNGFVYPNELKYATFKLNEDFNNLDFGSNDGMLLSIPWSTDNYAVQLAVDDAGRKMSIRSKGIDGWTNWDRVLSSSNYKNYVTPASIGADASGSANTALTNAKAYTDAEIKEWVGNTTVAAQINAVAANYLPITGGTIVGEGTVKLIPQRSNMEGGEIALGAPSGSPTLNSIILDNYNGKFRVFGYPSADGTTKTGVGTPLVVDPYDKTVTGSGGDYTFYAAKYVVSSAISMEYDSTNECLNFVFK